MIYTIKLTELIMRINKQTDCVILNMIRQFTIHLILPVQGKWIG